MPGVVTLLLVIHLRITGFRLKAGMTKMGFRDVNSAYAITRRK